MIERPSVYGKLKTALEENPIAALLGPRQCGKTTLARHLAQETREASDRGPSSSAPTRR